MFDVIVVPLDGSRLAEFSLAPALGIARRSGGRLDLVSVSDSLPAAPEELATEAYREEPVGRYPEEKRRELLELWEEGSVDLAVYRGPVAASIEERVRTQEAGLVVGDPRTRSVEPVVAGKRDRRVRPEGLLRDRGRAARERPRAGDRRRLRAGADRHGHTRSRGIARGLLGSVTDKVLRASTSPVLLQRPRPERTDE